MATSTSKSVKKGTTTSNVEGSSTVTRKASELLVVTHNDVGANANITVPLAKNNINLECFTAYEWGAESAFRMVTDNNKKAADVLRSQGYSVQESPIALWYTHNEPGSFTKAATALANAHINTYCSYSTTVPGSDTTIIAFNTDDTNRTIDVLNHLRS